MFRRFNSWISKGWLDRGVIRKDANIYRKESYEEKLRKKIDANTDNSMIETVRGLGYRLNV